MNRSRIVLSVLSEEQQAEFKAEFESMVNAGVEFIFESDPDQALEMAGGVRPLVVIVGMDLGPMEGLELLALFSQKNPTSETPIAVLPNKEDPFPPVIHRRENASGRSLTEETTFDQLWSMIIEVSQEEQLFKSAETTPSRAGTDENDPSVATMISDELKEGEALKPVETDSSPAPVEEIAAPVMSSDSPSAKSSTAQVPIGSVMEPKADQGKAKWPIPVAIVGVLVVLGVGGILLFSAEKGTDPASAPPAVNSPPRAAPATRSTAKPSPSSKVQQTPSKRSSTSPDTSPDTKEQDTKGASKPQAPALAKSSSPRAAPDFKKGVLPLSFDKGQSKAMVSDDQRMARVVTAMKQALQQKPRVRILIGGHTSAEGNDTFNTMLGFNRAEVARELLIRAGVPKGRVVLKSYAGKVPRASNRTAAGRAQNRYVTFELIH